MGTVTQLLIALMTPMIAILATWIAYQQLRIHKYRGRLDLYEKRFNVFLAVREFLKTAAFNRRPPIEALDQFNMNTAEAPFLFDGDVNKYLHTLQNTYLAIWNISEQQAEEGFSDPQEEGEYIKRRRELRSSMRHQLSEAKNIFLKYLDMSSL